MYKLITQYPLWFTFFCVLAAAGYSYLLYSKAFVWTKQVNYLLASIRFVLVFFLTFLLLGPLINYFQHQIENPKLVLALDNSESITLSESKENLVTLKKNIAALKEKLEDASFDVSIQSFDPIKNSLDTAQLFSFPSTNISGLLNDIQSVYENRNLAGVVLISDGIYNLGISPEYITYPFKLHSLAVGDTVPKLDVKIKNVFYNKLTFVSNKFPIVLEIQNIGFSGKSAVVQLREGAKIIQSSTVQFNRTNTLSKVEFTTSSAEIGVHHYVVEVLPLKGEYTIKNNRADVYIDVIENREKILLVASSPHPDIKAIRAAIESKEHYELELFIPGIHEHKEDTYDLVIFHQLPDYSGTAKNLLEKYQASGVPLLYIIGNQTNVNQFNNINKVLAIQTYQNQKDLVLPSFNETFERFTTTSEEKSIMVSFPPLIVPYGEYRLKQDVDILLYQRVGNTLSNKPLIMASADRKQAVISGEGIWRWRLSEFSETNSHQVFDSYFGNLIQYLSAKEDKRKFRVYPTSSEFMTSDPIYMEVEVYNDLLERLYGQQIDLKIKNEEGVETAYAFANGENNTRFEVRGLSQGVYRYEATTEIGGKNERSKGQFTIKALQLEALTTTADYDFLRRISSKHNGRFELASNWQLLADSIIAKKPQNILHTSEEMVDFISIPWLFLLFIALASTEWLLRKRKGSY